MLQLIVGLIILVLIVNYWSVVLPLAVIGLVIWGITKVAKNRSAHDITRLTPSKKVASTNKAYSDLAGVTVNQDQNSHPASIKVSTKNQISVSADDLWVPFGKVIQHAGFSISGGLIYFGTGLKSVRCWNEEPSLIDPGLSVDKFISDREGHHMSYWPSYSQIHPESRRAFLEWLAGGRSDPKVDIGYIFIFFYGLERRALADSKGSASAKGDIPIIIKEVKRLLSIYGENRSFYAYATSFIEAVQISQLNGPLYLASPKIESCSWEFPLSLKLALGQMAKDNVPLPDEWALVWAQKDPSMPKRMPVQRCPEEFKNLFKIRYREYTLKA